MWIHSETCISHDKNIQSVYFKRVNFCADYIMQNSRISVCSGKYHLLEISQNFPFAKFNRRKKSEKVNSEMKINVNPLSANITKWSNTLKQFFSKLPTNCFSVFDHFVGLALKRLKTRQQCYYWLVFSLFK